MLVVTLSVRVLRIVGGFAGFARLLPRMVRGARVLRWTWRARRFGRAVLLLNGHVHPVKGRGVVEKFLEFAKGNVV